ncbi:MAG: hypothetical protein ACE5IL_07025 [Myxococcota bacterium]
MSGSDSLLLPQALCRARGLALALLLLSCASTSFEGLERTAMGQIERGAYREAAANLEQALKLASETPVDSRALVHALAELGNLYLTYTDLGRESSAEGILLEARRLADEKLEPGSRLRLDVLDRLGTLYIVSGRWEQAREPMEAYLEQVEAAYGPETAFRSQVAANLTEVYSRLGEERQLQALRSRIENPNAMVAESREVETFRPDRLFVAPNVEDRDGTPAFVHLAQARRPLRVAVPLPDRRASGSTLEETRSAARRGFSDWERAIRRLDGDFALEFTREDSDADIVVAWTRRPRSRLAGDGGIGFRVVEGELRTRGRVMLSVQPIPSRRYRLSPQELRVQAMHAFGYALGLRDCRRCDSAMSLDWLRSRRFRPTDLDLRTLEALLRTPNGTRVDGSPLLALRSDALPQVALRSPSPDRRGVLADLPMLNTGRGATVLIDLAPPGARSFVFELDTGATDSVLTDDYARSMGISVRSAKTDPYRRKTVTGRDLQFWVMGQHVVGAGRGPAHLDYALLGGEFLRHFVVEVDFLRGRVRLLDPELHPVVEGRRDERVLDLPIREGRPYVRLELGTGAVWALVDTGFEGASIAITEEKARSLGIPLDPDAPRVQHTNVLGTQISTVQKLDHARLGTLSLEDVELQVGVRSESSVRVARWLEDETVIGLDLLDDYIVRFDYPHQKLGLTPIRGYPVRSAAASVR